VIALIAPGESMSRWANWANFPDSGLLDSGLKGRQSCCIVEVGAKWSCGPFNQSLVLPIFIYQVSAIKDL